MYLNSSIFGNARTKSLIPAFVIGGLVSLLAVSLVPSTSYASTTTNGSVTTITEPMTLRMANTSELAVVEDGLGATILPFDPELGADINPGFFEIDMPYHTGRAWVGEKDITLDACAKNIEVAITGDYKITHIANSGPLVNVGDEPEAGAALVNAGSSEVLASGGVDDNLAVGGSINVAVEKTSITLEKFNAGLKLALYVETRDVISQQGVNASFTQTGTPILEVTYDNSDCDTGVTVETTIPVNVGGESVARAADATEGATLPFTGSSSTYLAIASISVLALGIGVFIFGATRRRYIHPFGK